MSPKRLSCPACGELNPARAKFCSECGSKLEVQTPVVAEVTPSGASAGERRLVTILFADLSGFTSFSERSDIEDARAIAHEAAERLSEIVVRFGGTVDKIIGDEVMALFGAPVSHEDDPERAVRAALEMRAHVTEHSEKFGRLQLHVGVNTGEVMFGAVGSGGQLTVIGDAVNTAARLEAASTGGEILVGEATYLGSANAIEFEAAAPIAAKGKERPVPTWKAISVKGERVRRVALSALVGRRGEMDRAWELWERVRAGRRPRLATIVGAPGIGKSRLIEELARRIGDNAGVHWGRCLDYGEGITYWPVIEILNGAAGILHEDEPETVSAKLGLLLESLGSSDLDELRTMAVALANLVGAPATPRGTYQATKIGRGELHWGIRRVFQLLAAQRPLLLIFEDLHWAEPTLIDLILFLLEGDDAPLLVIGSGRPELKERAPALVAPKLDRRLIELDALGEDESFDLVAQLAGAAGLADSDLQPLLRAATGNPLFLEEMVRMLADSPTNGKGGASKTAPTSLNALIGARLDSLTGPEKRLAQNAAVIGNVFWSGALAHLDERNGEVNDGLDGLVARDMIHTQAVSTITGEREFAFKHAVIRDVAYGRLPKSRRIGLHTRCGEWIAALPGGPDELIEIVAYHLEQACLIAQDLKQVGAAPPILQAVKSLTRAGEKAEGREGTREADRYYARALELVGNRMPETAVELRLYRSRTTAALGDLDRASQELAAVAREALTLGRADLQFDGLLILAHIDMLHGRASDAGPRVAEAERLATELGDYRRQVAAAFERANIRAHFEGSVEAASQTLREALSLAQTHDERELVLGAHVRLGVNLVNTGQLAEAEEQFVRCIELAQLEGSVRSQALATTFLGYVKFYRGEPDEAERLATQSLEWLQRTAERPVELQNLQALARFALQREDFLLADRRLKEALMLAGEVGGWLAVEISRDVVESLARQGRAGEARLAAESARAGMPEESVSARAAMLLADGWVAAAEGDEARSRQCFEAALPMLDGQGFVIDLGEAHIAFARTLAGFGDGVAATEQLDQARQVFARMDASGKLAEIDRELAGLARGGKDPAPLDQG